jgi:hypothetical protein
MPQPYRPPGGMRQGRSCYSTPRPLLMCSLAVLALLISSLSPARPFVPSRQERARVLYQPARLCLPPPAMAFTALKLPTCTGVLVPGVEVPKV